MTKFQVLSYLGIVLGITIAAYIYTSIAEAPVVFQSEEAGTSSTSSTLE